MKVLKWLDKYFEETILIGILMVMTLIMGTQVCSRYLFNYSLSWTEELTRYLFVWSGFLTISFAAQRGIAIRIEQLALALKEKPKAILMMADCTVEFVFFGYLIPFAWKYFMSTMESGQLSTACEMPMWIIHIAPFVGFVLAEFRLIQRWIGELKKIREEK